MSTAGSKSNTTRLSRTVATFLHIIVAVGLREVASLLHLHIFSSSTDLTERFSRKTIVRIICVNLGAELSQNPDLSLSLSISAQLLSRCFLSFDRGRGGGEKEGKKGLSSSPEFLRFQIEHKWTNLQGGFKYRNPRTQYSPPLSFYIGIARVKPVLWPIWRVPPPPTHTPRPNYIHPTHKRVGTQNFVSILIIAAVHESDTPYVPLTVPRGIFADFVP